MEESENKVEVKNSPIITEETAGEMDSFFDEKELEAQEKVEASLFIAGKFLNIQELVMLTDVNPLMLKEILHRLEKKYSEGAIRLIHRNNSWKMDVAEKYHSIVNKLATGSTEFTKAEQETLAVIAYKQPIKQSVVIKIRGNKAYEHIHKFIETGLVVGKREGHTKILSLSEDFYEYFYVQKGEKGEIEGIKDNEGES
jgi:segregation and condensation protein B